MNIKFNSAKRIFDKSMHALQGHSRAALTLTKLRIKEELTRATERLPIEDWPEAQRSTLEDSLTSGWVGSSDHYAA